MNSMPVVIGALALASCAYTPQEQFTSTAYDYNLTIEQSQNQMLLVNIVRASERRPMYFSAVSAMRGALTTEISPTLGVEFMTQSARASTASPGLRFAANPTFDFVPLDSKNFTRGILNPVPLDSLVYYWNQGWPQELLLHLFIQSIELKGVVYANYPPRTQDLGDFQRKLREILCDSAEQTDPKKCKLTLQSDDDLIDTPIVATSASLREATELDKAGLRLVKAESGYSLAAKKKSPHIRGAVNPECQKEKEAELNSKLRADDSQLRDKQVANRAAARQFCSPRIFLRSPEAMLYYLGEIMRVNVDNGKGPLIYICDGKQAELFRGRRDSAEPAIVSVKYDGHVYSIPREDSSEPAGCARPRSMHALSLINQLINQNKDLADLPTTGAVTIVGPK